MNQQTDTVAGFDVLLMDDDEVFMCARALEIHAEQLRTESRKSTWHGENLRAVREDFREKAMTRERLARRLSEHLRVRKANR